jgi:hypothetical protein
MSRPRVPTITRCSGWLRALRRQRDTRQSVIGKGMIPDRWQSVIGMLHIRPFNLLIKFPPGSNFDATISIQASGASRFLCTH